MHVKLLNLVYCFLILNTITLAQEFIVDKSAYRSHNTLPQKEDEKDYYQIARNHLENGNIKSCIHTAIIALENNDYLKSDFQTARIHLLLAQAYCSLNEIDLVRKYLELAKSTYPLESDPITQIEYHSVLGLLNNILGEFEQALLYFQMALEKA
jgi:tetratricopeptide (TPR) repeat protein